MVISVVLRLRSWRCWRFDFDFETMARSAVAHSQECCIRMVASDVAIEVATVQRCAVFWCAGCDRR